MTETFAPILRIADDAWDELLARLHAKSATQICICGADYLTDEDVRRSLKEVDLDPETNVLRGKIPAGLVGGLPTTLRHLCLIEQGLGETGAKAIGDNLKQLTTLNISRNSIGHSQHAFLPECQLPSMEVASTLQGANS